MFNPVQVFHLGTIAFGSLILAIIRTIRTILEYAEKKCKKFNNDLTRYDFTRASIHVYPS